MNEKYREDDRGLDFESGVRFLDEAFGGDGMGEEAKLLANEMTYHSKDTFTSLALISDAVVTASWNSESGGDDSTAQNSFLIGALTGLCVARELQDDLLTPEAMVPSVESLKMAQGEGVIDGAQITQDSLNLLASTQAKTDEILQRWARASGASPESVRLYRVGFGFAINEANKAVREVDILRQLEETSNWDVPFGQDDSYYLDPVDEDCRRLEQAFKEHVTSIKLTDDQGVVDAGRMALITSLLARDFEKLIDLQIDSKLQVRGSSICLQLNEVGLPDDMLILNPDISLAGSLIGIECLPVPTDYALITEVYDDRNLYEPLVCLIMENVELTNEAGETTVSDNVFALPLRGDDVSVSKMIINPRSV